MREERSPLRWEKRKFSLLNWVSLGGRKVDSGIRGLRRTTSASDHLCRIVSMMSAFSL